MFASGANAGLYATNSARGTAAYIASQCCAAYFNGNVSVVGTLTKSSGTFRIDHPLDPANKYLYDGIVSTDELGEAIVQLPDYFDALNRDVRYQLTVIGRFAQAIVAEEVRDHHFVIRTSEPGVKVSWQVTGIRQDAFARAHPVIVEEDKPAEERGTYLHPDSFGRPPGEGLAARLQAAAPSAPTATPPRR